MPGTLEKLGIWTVLITVICFHYMRWHFSWPYCNSYFHSHLRCDWKLSSTLFIMTWCLHCTLCPKYTFLFICMASTDRVDHFLNWTQCIWFDLKTNVIFVSSLLYQHHYFNIKNGHFLCCVICGFFSSFVSVLHFIYCTNIPHPVHL